MNTLLQAQNGFIKPILSTKTVTEFDQEGRLCLIIFAFWCSFHSLLQENCKSGFLQI